MSIYRSSSEAPKQTGPYLRYDGGDTSDALNYSLMCGCGVRLHRLGVLRANASGQRSCYCPQCKHATCVDARGQILSYSPFDITKQPQSSS